MKHLEIEKQIIEQLHDLPLEADTGGSEFCCNILYRNHRLPTQNRGLWGCSRAR